VKEKQDLRKQASVEGVDVVLSGGREALRGEELIMMVGLNSGENNFLGMGELQVKYDKDKLKVVAVENGGVDVFFGEMGMVKEEIDAEAGTILLSLVAVESDMSVFPKGFFNVLKIRFEAIAEGEAKVLVEGREDTVFLTEGDDFEVNNLVLGNTNELVYNILDEEIDESLGLNFWVSFSGLRALGADCADEWRVRATVVGEGKTKVYENVRLLRDGEERVELWGNDAPLARYRGRIFLPDFEVGDKVAVFLKGPMHIQVKYGENNQNSWYEKEGGEIVLGQGENDFVYNFAQYPLLAGDVTGESEGVSDGILDSRDFSYVKSKVSVDRNLLSGEEALRGDFDGNCTVGNIDLAILILSMRERQSQVY